jgi:hypothetical protein
MSGKQDIIEPLLTWYARSPVHRAHRVKATEKLENLFRAGQGWCGAGAPGKKIVLQVQIASASTR